MIMEKFKIFLSSILAGMAIAIGGIANLTLENKVAGAIRKFDSLISAN